MHTEIARLCNEQAISTSLKRAQVTPLGRTEQFCEIYKKPSYVKTNSKCIENPKTSGQSYKQFTLVIYDSRVVIWGILKSGTTLES